MRIAYIDCSSGIAGDMLLGAWLDAGVPLEILRSGLAFLRPEGVALDAVEVRKHGIRAIKAEVGIPDDTKHRHLSEVHAILDRGALPDVVKSQARAVFRRLAEAEARVHGTDPDKVHFHEVGALDAIADVTGSLLAVHHLGIDRIIASPVAVGSGKVHSAHGWMPVPAPATIQLLRGVPTFASGAETEIVTPTGAALLTHLAGEFGPMPPMIVETVAYGAGTKDLPGLPNVLRILVGESTEVPEGHPVSVIETNIDDMNPEVFGYVFERLLEAGALDVFTHPIHMKKNRPATLLTVIAPVSKEHALAEIVLAETTSLGVRVTRSSRYCLRRRSFEVETGLGPVRIKATEGPHPKFAPEYDDCRRIARERRVPILQVYEEARRAAGDRDPATLPEAEPARDEQRQLPGVMRRAEAESRGHSQSHEPGQGHEPGHGHPHGHSHNHAHDPMHEHRNDHPHEHSHEQESHPHPHRHASRGGSGTD